MIGMAGRWNDIILMAGILTIKRLIIIISFKQLSYHYKLDTPKGKNKYALRTR